MLCFPTNIVLCASFRLLEPFFGVRVSVLHKLGDRDRATTVRTLPYEYCHLTDFNSRSLKAEFSLSNITTYPEIKCHHSD